MSAWAHRFAVAYLACSGSAYAGHMLPEGVTCPDPEAKEYDYNCSFVFDEEEQKKLNEVYGRLLSSLSIAEAKKLRSSQRAWLAYRNADVMLVVEHYGEGGSLGESVAARRSFQITKARVKELELRLANKTAW